MDIGGAIKIIRVKHKVSQQELAKGIGVTQGYLSLIEKGEREPGFDLIGKIADMLRVPPQLLFILACHDESKTKHYAKPLRNMMMLADDVLQAI